jgi:two-component system NtrC family sensor kinase
LAVPLVDRGDVIGIIQMRSKERGVYAHSHLELAERIGNQVAGGIANAQLYSQTLQAEQELRESEERFRQISESVAEIVYLLDHRNHKLLWVNESFKELYGYPGDDFYQNPDFWLEFVHPDDRAGIETALEDQLSNGKLELEYRIIRPDQTVRLIYDRTFPILNEAGEVYRIVGIAEDITERKRTEERLHETARLASIGELAAGVAHEINNPLTSVQGYSEMVLSKNLPEEVSADIQTIYDEAQRAAKIVQNLLFFARKRNTEKQYLDLNSVLSRALEMKSYDFRVSNVDVVTDLAPGNHKTMVDEHQLVQVFLNILTNAEQAIHQEGAEGQIWVTTTGSDDYINITIKDDGPGMLPEDLGKIFEPFFTTKEVGQGTGLGLSISYGIIKQHDGDIWAESVEGEGTAFHITLPVVSPDNLDISDGFPLASAEQTTKHILVVDDEPQIRNLLAKYLESERYTVDLAEDGHEAWRKAANMDYDCILLDLKMPGMSGQELYNLIQEISEHLASKVVFVTGDTVSSGTQDFIAGTGNPVVVKPFRMEELLRTIHELWDNNGAGLKR